jgi:DNA-binding transcriptional ArsR family regulator
MMVVMASTTDMLQTTLGETAYAVLKVLAASPRPMSGRMVASMLGVAPTTATAALGKLREAGFAMSSREGRADRWHLQTDNAVLRSWLEETRGEPSGARALGGMSPYPTGGGGVTFERKVAVQYLAHLLVGDGAMELGDGRFVVSVAFQQSPEHSVDDLIIRAACADELEPSLVLAVGVRRSPDLVRSDDSTRKLIRAFVHEVISAPVDGPEHRVALVVAGAQDHAKQLKWLADLAFNQMDAPSFFKLVSTPGKFSTAIRGRLDHIEALVRLAVVDLGVADPGAQVVQQRTWELLSRLTVLMPRLETPDEADWAAVTNDLIPVARGADLYGASRLRDRLVALADEYPPKAATVDLSLLQRDAHQALDSTTRRHGRGWQALAHLHARAIASVRHEIVSGDGSRTIHLDRGDAAAELLAAAGSATAAVVAHGDSGVGKSALVIGAVTGAASSDPDGTEALCINLRHLPTTTLELEAFLGAPLATLLAELSAPRRLLVIDGADAISEGLVEPLRYLVDAGSQADVTVIAVAASDTKQLVRDVIAERSGRDVTEYLVPPLTDPEVDSVISMFGELAALATNPRSRELLRRPVVVDLLVRGGVAGTPLSDADAMQQVWAGLVRRHEQSDRGTPDARELALLHLADLALCGGDALDVVGAIDAAALDGLRHDGLLRTSPDDPFRIGPEFAHDEVRRYAVARLILPGGNPTSKLADAGVPRWSLGAARLACQALLAAPPTPTNPLRGRFARFQGMFDNLVEAGHGDRWGDVPGEALLTLGDPDAILRDAWPGLCAEPGLGLQRLTRLVGQRLRDEKGLVRPVAVEPLINLLLDDETPWRSGEHVQDLLRDWLQALVIADTPAGHPLRIRLRDRLVAACATADRRLQADREAAAAARAARTPEEVEKERQFIKSHPSLFTEIGYPRRRRRARPEVPREITDDVMVELLALLGPDLGDQGEAVLRRVAQNAPSSLRPAVEELFTGRALAIYRQGFLAEVTEAYYIDDEEDGSGLHEDGIRDHRARAFGVTPLAAWYRGPFMALFQFDFRNGVAVLNRMLNHAVLARSRALAELDHQYGAPIDDSALDVYRTQLDITGTSRVYVGDGHAWAWYRGTTAGPYPCMSALQALERVCDQLVEIGIPLGNIVATLLDGCENLAMVGLVVGLLVRHLEDRGRLLDPYLAEPMIWHLEFGRVVHESSGLAASSEGIVLAERRQWSLREAAMLLVLQADETRADELRTIGQQLVETMRRLVVEALGEDGDEATVEKELVTVRAWAAGLDQATYEAHQAEDVVYVESRPPDDIVEAMQRKNEELRGAQEATRLMVRYHIRPRQGTAQPITAEDLITDLAVAQELLDNPPALSPTGKWDAPVAAAAAALEANIVSGVELPNEALCFAVEAVIRVGNGEVSPHQFESEESYFEQGADRSAARVLPLLLLPKATVLRAAMDAGDGSETYSSASAAAGNIARSLPNEVRVYLARGLDRVWEVPCTGDGTCHHGTALRLAIETMRDSAFGPWDPNTGRHRVTLLADPVDQALADTPDKAIHFSRLDAAIRALAPAARANICVSERAHELLTVLLAAHRRSLLASEHDMDHRGTHALIAARALLTIAADGDDAPIYEHIDAYADNSGLLSNFLRALSAAAEESPDRSATAARIWPSIVTYVIGLQETGHTPFQGRHYDDYGLASLVPNNAGEVTYLYRELEKAPISWWQPLSWQSTIEQWLPLGLGNARCVDQLISFLGPLAPEDQARLGIPWVARLVLADPSRVANRTYLLSSWLIEVRQAASDAGVLADWQRIVDALVVAGVSRLAPYSE